MHATTEAVGAPGPEVVSRWYFQLRADDPILRMNAIADLVRAGYTSRRMFFLLRRSLHHDNVAVAQAALGAIQTLFPGEWKDCVYRVWQLSNPEHRSFAAEILASEMGEEGRDFLARKLSFLAFHSYPEAWRALANHHADWLLDRCMTWSDSGLWQERAVAAQAIAALPVCGWGNSSQEESHSIRDVCLKKLLGMCEDAEEQVRIAAVRSLYSLDREAAIKWTLAFLKDPNHWVRETAVDLADNHNLREALPTLWTMVHDDSEEVRASVLSLVTDWDSGERATALVRQALSDESDEVRLVAAREIRDVGNASDVVMLGSLLATEQYELAEEVLDSILHLGQGDALALALRQGLSLPSGDLVSRCVNTLRGSLPAKEWEDAVVLALPTARIEGGLVLVRALQEHAPKRWYGLLEEGQVETFPWPVDPVASQRILRSFFDAKDPKAIPLFVQGLEHAIPLIASEALHCLYLHDQEKGKEQCLQRLGASSPLVRLAAVEQLENDNDPLLVDDLLPRTRDADANVRYAALKALAKYDDPRIVSELVSSLRDVELRIRHLARQILQNEVEYEVPVLRTFGSRSGRRARWKELDEKAQEINLWASKIGQQLLGRPVRIHQHRQGLGYTLDTDADAPIDVFVSDTPVTSGHPYGEEIMKGLALHEIGHHLFDIGVRGHTTMQGIARSEGIKDIYDILIDERLERGMRSRRPEWGKLFDRLGSYAFAQNAHVLPVEEYARLLEWEVGVVIRAIRSNEIPGRLVPLVRTRGVAKVVLRDRDLLGIPQAIPPLYAFLWCLRCGFDPKMHPNPNIAAAVALVPKNLKDLRHADVLQLSRDISELLGTGEDNRKKWDRTMGLLNECPHLRGVFGRIKEGLGEAKQLPDWMHKVPTGIRHNQAEEAHEKTTAVQHLRKGGRFLNLDDTLEFPPLKHLETLEPDSEKYANLVGPIRRHIRKMRSFFERLGKETHDVFATRRGRRLDMGQVRSLALRNNANVLVQTVDCIAPDLYLGVLIDRSGSMQEGERMEQAKSFATLLAESARGLRGIEGRIHAFDERTLFDLGTFQRNTIEQLDACGGNNDAAALQRAAELALKSQKKHCLLVMISDGLPAECSVASLRHVVRHLTEEHGIICAQVAVAPLAEICFPHYLDLSQHTLDEAVSRFGRLIMKLTTSWR
ncbi:MAG: hypothetical protein EP343_31465 [Deltaproteobacteria bacterium]|nr:MAG: hypothetical protein EP343_31465 [Deltaproteobacteria bacterium]